MNQILGSDDILDIDEKYKHLANFAPIGIFITNKDGDCLFVNKKWCKIAGLSPDEADGQGWIKGIHPDDREQVFSKWYDFVESGKNFQMECRFQNRIGKITWVSIETSKIKRNSGEVIGYTGVLSDISSKKLNEEELIKTNFLMETIINTTDTLLAYLDTEFNFIQVNEAYSRADDKDRSFFKGKNHFDLYPNEENKEIFESVVESGEPFFISAKPFEYPNNTEREITYWDWSLIPTKGESNEVNGLILSLIDVTNQIESQNALSESEKRFRRIFEDSPLGISLIGKNLQVIMANQAHYKILGYTERELKSLKVEDITNPDDHEIEKSLTEQLIQGKISNFKLEKRFIRKDHEVFWGNLTASATYDEEGEFLFGLGMIEDITERKRIENAQRESDTKYRILVEQSLQGISILQEGKFIFANPQLAKITGYSVEELLSMSAKEISEMIHPEDRESVLRKLKNRLQGKKVSTGYTLRGVKKDGTVYWIQHFPVLIQYNQKPATQVTTTEITERVMAEEARKLNESRLEVLMKVNQMMDKPINDIADIILKEGINLTNSEYGFLGYIDEAQEGMVLHSWSKKVLKDCKITNKPRYTPIDKAGVWADCVRMKKPSIIDDYSSYLKKKGYPKGHVEIRNLLSVPIINKEKVSALIVVANKTDSYDKNDINQLKLLLEGMWNHIQRENSQKILQESEERFRKIYEEAPIGIILTDLNYRQFMINDTFCRMIGYREEELKNMTFVEFSHPEDNIRKKKLAEKLKNGEIPEFTIEKQYIKKNKESFWARTHVTLIRDENNIPVNFLVMIEDITEHKKIELEYQRQSLRFNVKNGELYLSVESTPIAAGNAFNDLQNIGYKGVIFSRKCKKELREDFHGDFEYYWMNQINYEGSGSFQQNIIKRVKQKELKTVILFDRLDFIISTVGFNETLSLIYKLKDYAYLNNLVILFSIDQITIDQKEKALLLKEMNPLLPRRLIELSNESLEILRLVFSQNNSGYQPSQTELCIKLNLSRPTARKRIKKLVSTGFLTETRRGNRKDLELSERGRSFFN